MNQASPKLILNVVTAVSRPENSLRISHNLSEVEDATPGIEVRWHCVFEPTVFDRVPWHGDHMFPFHFAAMGHRKGNPAGGALRNIALDYIKTGLVYCLDDDNLIHPELIPRVLENFKYPDTAPKGLVVSQATAGGLVRLRANGVIVSGNIDTGQFVFPRYVIGPSRFNDLYDSDYYFFTDVIRGIESQIIYEPETVASYYNAII